MKEKVVDPVPSVTVSIAALTIGKFNVIFSVSLVFKLTSLGSTSDFAEVSFVTFRIHSSCFVRLFGRINKFLSERSASPVS